MEYALLALKGPSNIEKKVRELQSSLYRQGGLTSALALPVMIPLCFVEPGVASAKPSELRRHLRLAVGKEAPYLTSKSIAECDGFLFWDLAPRRELERLRRSCERVFAPASSHPRAERQSGRQLDLIPVCRGFFLCSLEGRSRSAVPSPAVSEPLRFPAKSVFLLHLHPLETEPWRNERGVCATEDRPWWNALYWEKLGEIPLRKSKTTG